ncbi:hypothetical protein Pst134EA_022866 [Puccinia striiformis f. sp. tritici]|nr:hypothetical protein Pst134EA_022866 [Puccinia striiformis f. sp. tritici]KAH9445903.1 hypothetical protein Pst134EB_023734 [Puccinia striiformis f. sp. tritici]KAH9455398.1 hypothetical protein Pst134EA_022866 [Puccinia striiformis f. sp. tritici]
MAFNLEHCYVLLKDSPKFQATQEKVDARVTKSQAPKAIPKTPSNSATRPSSPSLIDVKDEEQSERSILGNERMEGQKATQKKRADDESMGKIVHLQKELLLISRERLDTVKLAVQDAADEVILSKDLSSMDDRKRQYYEKKLKVLYDREDGEEAAEIERVEKQKEKEKEKERLIAEAKEKAMAEAEKKKEKEKKAQAKAMGKGKGKGKEVEIDVDDVIDTIDDEIDIEDVIDTINNNEVDVEDNM